MILTLWLVLLDVLRVSVLGGCSAEETVERTQICDMP